MVLGEMVWELKRRTVLLKNCLFVPMPCGSVATLVPLEVWWTKHFWFECRVAAKYWAKHSAFFLIFWIYPRLGTNSYIIDICTVLVRYKHFALFWDLVVDLGSAICTVAEPRAWDGFGRGFGAALGSHKLAEQHMRHKRTLKSQFGLKKHLALIFLVRFSVSN